MEKAGQEYRHFVLKHNLHGVRFGFLPLFVFDLCIENCYNTKSPGKKSVSSLNEVFSLFSKLVYLVVVTISSILLLPFYVVFDFKNIYNV